MFGKAFRSLCVGCGGECGYDKMLCPDCVAELPRPEIFCGGCGHPLPVPAEHCKHCDDREAGIDCYHSDYLYTGVMRDIIRRIKYDWRWRGTGQLGELCEAAGLNPADYDRMAPIPFHFLRRFARYVQPVTVVAGSLQKSGFRYSNLLTRTVHTEYQSRLSRSERRDNVRGVFKVNEDVRGMRILLVDDVITTGATLAEAAKTLKRRGAERVDVYTLLTGVPR